jgi:hypothetical protein
MPGSLFIASNQTAHIVTGVATQAGTKALVKHIAQSVGQRAVHCRALGAHASMVSAWQIL